VVWLKRRSQDTSCLASGEPWGVPEISRFFGIVIRMFVETGAPHQRPHFHAYYQQDVEIFAIDVIEAIGGALPRRQARLVMAWAEIHQNELLQNWEALQGGGRATKIEPLR
jgi:hypothetical protein